MDVEKALRELNLRAGATEEEIHRAYLILVAKWHPDKHQNDPIRLSEAELRIKNINRAFEKLQSVGFQTKKTTSKKDHTSAKNSGTKKKSENRNSEQKADEKRNNPNPQTYSTNSTTTKGSHFSGILVILLVLMGGVFYYSQEKVTEEIADLKAANIELKKEIVAIKSLHLSMPTHFDADKSKETGKLTSAKDLKATFTPKPSALTPQQMGLHPLPAQGVAPQTVAPTQRQQLMQSLNNLGLKAQERQERMAAAFLQGLEDSRRQKQMLSNPQPQLLPTPRKFIYKPIKQTVQRP